jgi:putative transposase
LLGTWAAQQLREAFPWAEAPRYLRHDRDPTFGALRMTVNAMGIEELLTAPVRLAKMPSSSDSLDLPVGSVSIT